MIIDNDHPVTFPFGIQTMECLVKVTHYLPERPAQLQGAMEDAEEALPAEISFTVQTLDGIDDPALEGLMTEADEDRLLDEFEAYLLAVKYLKEF